MSAGFCTRCGAVLRDGVCPRGHPQRATRGRPRRRRRRRGPITFIVLLLLLAGAAYAGLFWYPVRAAGDLMRPSSAEYVEAAGAYRDAVATLPTDAPDAESAVGVADELATTTDEARALVADALIRLQERKPASIPIVSGRRPLEEALALRERMLAFYSTALDGLDGIGDVAGYLTDVSQALPELENLERAIGDPRGQGAVEQAIEDAKPVAEQLVGDIEAVEAPDEVGSLNAELLAIVRRIRDDLDAAEETGGAAATLIAQLLSNVRDEVVAFRDALAGAAQSARESGLGPILGEARRVTDEIDQGLADLDTVGVSGLTLPS